MKALQFRFNTRPDLSKELMIENYTIKHHLVVHGPQLVLQEQKLHRLIHKQHPFLQLLQV